MVAAHPRALAAEVRVAVTPPPAAVRGVCGIVDLRRPPDRDELERMVGAVPHRSRSSRETYIGESVALAGLATHRQAAAGATLAVDGTVAVVADARIDNRSTLVPRLQRAGLLKSDRPSDAELVLGAYRLWGVETARHLRGDFCFVAWDDERQLLYGARDPMAMRSLQR